MEAMEYSLMAGGKRLRPYADAGRYIICLEEEKQLMEPFMAAMEMIHTYSLVHDDLPAMDNDAYRQRKKDNPCCLWRRYGDPRGRRTC